jgi:hypothetical protein
MPVTVTSCNSSFVGPAAVDETCALAELMHASSAKGAAACNGDLNAPARAARKICETTVRIRSVAIECSP